MKAEERPLFEDVVLSALLHDIGKFGQRTGSSEMASDNKARLCPYSEKVGRYTHRHVLWTDGFFIHLQDVFPNSINPRRCGLLAAKHHRVETTFDAIIQAADRISAGTDRSKKEQIEEAKFFEQPLKNIFNGVHFEKRDPPESLYYRLGSLEVENVFPRPFQKLSKEQYQELWQQFIGDFRILGEKRLKYQEFIKALDSVLERYLWCIPSSTIDEPDISLYDHVVTTAAFASVLYRYHQA